MEEAPKNESQIIDESTKVIRKLMTEDYATYESIVGDKIIDLKQKYGEKMFISTDFFMFYLEVPIRQE